MKFHRMIFAVSVCLISSFTSFAEENKTNSKINISHVFTLHGEPKYGIDAKHFDYVNPEAKKGGKVILPSTGTFDSFNLFVPKGNPAIGVSLIYEMLAAQSDDEPFSMYGQIAEKIEWPDDKSWVIFHINQKAKFHDGHTIDAQDVVFSFNTLIEKGDPLYKFYYGDVDRVEALDKTRAKFFLKPTENPELIPILGQLYIFPEHYWKDKDFSKGDLSIPLGSGPYKISAFKPGKSVTYSRVKDHWGRDHFTNKGRYNFDEVTYEYYRDSNVAFEAFKAGEYDIRRENIAKIWATGYDFPAIKKDLIKKIELEDGTPEGMTGFMINLRREKFQNINLRKALDYAFDFEWTNANIFHGSYMRTQSFFTNSELESSGPLKGRELDILTPFKEKLPDSVFTSVYQAPISDGSGRNRKNLRTAKKFLDEAGYKIQKNQLIDPKTNKPVTIEFLVTSSNILRFVNPYLKNLEKLGIKAEVRMVDQAQYINRVRSFNYDMFMGVVPQTLSPGNEQFDMWFSKSADKLGSRNFIGIKDEVVDELVDMIVRAPTREELVYRTRALDRVLLNYHLVVPLYHFNKHRVAYWDKFQRPKTHAIFDLGYSTGIYSWWYDENKAKRVNEAK